jgi:shikimate kinase
VIERGAARALALVGLPGSGKTTVGRQLARRLGADFIDTDAVIEQRLGESIRSFFEREGEDRFRDVETGVLHDILSGLPRGDARPVVLSTGGGIVLRPANRQALGGHAVTLYLRSSPEELFRRLRHDTQRPLLQVADPLKKLRDLFHARDPLYRETAAFVIETGRPSVATLVNMILMQVELAGLIDPAMVPSPVEPRPA